MRYIFLLACVQVSLAGAVTLEIVVPSRPLKTVELAADELADHVEMSVGVRPKIRSEDQATLTPQGVRFWVGATQAARAAGLPQRPFRADEHVVRIEGRDVYLLGGDRDGTGPADTGGKALSGTLYAVCDFLEHELGVRWLWPGRSGTYVPRRADLDLAPTERRSAEPLVFRCLNYPRKLDKGSPGFASVANGERLHAATWRFLSLHRMGASEDRAFAHSFIGWWDRHSKKHPEFFNLLPNGRREPLSGPNNGNRVSMCVSEPKLHDEILLLARRRGVKEFSVCENDLPGLCTCARCRSWDGPDPRFAIHPYWSRGEDPLTAVGRFGRLCPVFWEAREGGAAALNALEAPTLSDRYLKFYNAVATRARSEIDPSAEVFGYAYANYQEAPWATKVSPGVRIIYVPRTFYPYTQGESDYLRKQWSAWQAAGAAHMMLRPNYTLAGANLPVNYARRMAADFAWCFEHGMDAAFFDSLLGAWSAQAPTLYTLVRMLREPGIGYDRALDEFCSAFGKASDEIRAYAALQEETGDRLTLDRYFDLGAANRTVRGTAGGGFKYFVALAADLFSEDWFARADAILGRAAAKVADDAAAADRVAFLRKGLEDARLTCRCRALQKAGGDWREAFRQLRDYRASVESDGVCDWNFTVTAERRTLGWK